MEALFPDLVTENELQVLDSVLAAFTTSVRYPRVLSSINRLATRDRNFELRSVSVARCLALLNMTSTRS